MKIFKPKFWDNKKTFIFPMMLAPITLLNILISFIRKLFIKRYNFSIPVICVGNIYLGGTGKTPFSIKLFNILKNMYKNPVFIRKKYKSFHDEVILQKKIGSVYENNYRVHAINEAIQKKADVAILDDGFQDFSVNKSLSIICFNERQWIGNGFIIPSGPLRESLSALSRAEFAIINGEKNIQIEKIITEKNKNIKIYYTIYKPENIKEFQDKKVICFAGIGNPTNFFDLLSKYNVNIFEKKSFPDHYNYSEKELETLIEKSKKNNAILVTTEKDYFRIDEKYKKNIKYLKIEVEMQNENKFIEELRKIL